VTTHRSNTADEGRRHSLRLTLIVALVAALGLGAPAPSQAATYVIHSCRLPNGAPAPTERWTSRTAGDVTAINGCSAGGALAIQFGPNPFPYTPVWATPGSLGEWRFTAPPDTTIAGYVLYRVAHTHATNGPPPGASQYKLYQDIIGREMEICTSTVCRHLGGNPAVPRDPSNRFVATGQEAKNMTLTESCWRSDGGEGCPQWWIPSFYLYAADIALRDDHAPVISEASDPPANSQGIATLKLRASDQGGGLYRVRVLIDGRVAQDLPFSAAATNCAEPFAYAVPCPLSGQRSVPFDTRRLADGRHEFALAVVDAAGSIVRTEPSQIAVDNAGRSCVYGLGGRSAPRFRMRKRLLRARAGQRPVITGYLLRGRKGLRRVRVRAVARNRGQRLFHAAATARTTRTGHFRMRLRPGTSRRIRVAYCAPGGGAVKELRLEVRASSSLTPSKRKVSNGHSVMFRGRLTGRPVPRGGKLVEVQAYFRGHWRTFSTARTDRRGRWHFRYHFDGTRGRVKYRFRALIPSEAGYPYEPGASPARSVLVVGS
jgi:hypothetical protein